jgi:SAM-dependent methyltransferase
MNLKELERSWDYLGKKDPLWAVLTEPEKKGNKWQLNDFFQTGVKEILSLIQYLSSLDLEIPHGRALDFGCGVGRLTQALSDHFDEVCGVDIAPSMIRLANKYNRRGDKCRYYLNQSSGLHQFPNGHFDFICSFITLQHMEPCYSQGYLREFLRLLALQGLLVFQVPSKPPPGYEEELKRIRKRQRVKRLIPNALLDLYRRVRYGDLTSSRMEMYPLERATVVSLVEREGGKVIDIQEDQRVGHNWISLQYCVMKHYSPGDALRPAGA